MTGRVGSRSQCRCEYGARGATVDTGGARWSHTSGRYGSRRLDNAHASDRRRSRVVSRLLQSLELLIQYFIVQRSWQLQFIVQIGVGRVLLLRCRMIRRWGLSPRCNGSTGPITQALMMMVMVTVIVAVVGVDGIVIVAVGVIVVVVIGQHFNQR